MQKGILYICPTPIGNLEDITLRAIKILKQVDLIACEDTRVTRKLLNAHDIHTKTISYHKFSEKEKSSYIVSLLNEGNNIALVSDAGTPLISDPGSQLVNQCIENSIKIIPLPGACALTTAFCATYHDRAEFVFAGFLPKNKNEKEAVLNKYADINIIFYESPSRLVKSLQEISNIRGNINATVARELTKIYEEFKRGSIEELIEHYSNNAPKGEIVLIIEPDSKKIIEDADLNKQIQILKKAGYSTKEVSKILSLLTGVSKGKIYNMSIE